MDTDTAEHERPPLVGVPFNAMREQRRHPRLEFDQRAWCEHDNLTLYLPVGNVSREGMFLQTTTPFALGDRMRVSFDPPAEGGESIIAQVEIVWSCKTARGTSGVGVKVLKMEQGAQQFARILERLPES